MAKLACCVCGKSLGWFSDKTTLQDGAVCQNCLHQGGINRHASFENFKKISSKQLAEMIKKKSAAVKKFSAAKSNEEIAVDINQRLFKLESNFYFFDELISYSLKEYPSSNNQTSNRTSKGAAIGGVIGGMGGGLVGSAIGAAVGGKIGSLFATCEYMNIDIRLNNPLFANVKLDFISEKTNKSSKEYVRAVQRANDCLETLKLIEEHNASERKREREEKQKQIENVQVEKNVFVQEGHITASQIEKELMIYKNMWCSGIITEQDYEQKKKQLLNLK